MDTYLLELMYLMGVFSVRGALIGRICKGWVTSHTLCFSYSWTPTVCWRQNGLDISSVSCQDPFTFRLFRKSLGCSSQVILDPVLICHFTTQRCSGFGTLLSLICPKWGRVPFHYKEVILHSYSYPALSTDLDWAMSYNKPSTLI